MLSEPDLRAIRATVEAAFPDVIYRLRATRTADGAGGRSASWLRSTVGTPARVAAGSGQETTTSERVAPGNDYTIYTHKTADFRTTDRAELADGRVVEIVAVESGGKWDTCKCLAAKVVL